MDLVNIVVLLLLWMWGGLRAGLPKPQVALLGRLPPIQLQRQLAEEHLPARGRQRIGMRSVRVLMRTSHAATRVLGPSSVMLSGMLGGAVVLAALLLGVDAVGWASAGLWAGWSLSGSI